MTSLLLRTGLMGLLLVAVACCPRITSSVATEVSDSVYVKEIHRVDTFKVPADTVTLETFIECDPVTLKPKPLHQQNKSTRTAVALDINSNGKAKITGIGLDLFKLLEIRDKEINRLRNEKTTITKVVEVYKTRSIDIFCRWVVGILLLILLGYAALRYLKTITPWTRIIKP